MAARLIVIDTDVLVSTAGHPDKTFATWEAHAPSRADHDRISIRGTAGCGRAFEGPSHHPQLQANIPLFLAEYRPQGQFSFRHRYRLAGLA